MQYTVKCSVNIIYCSHIRSSRHSQYKLANFLAVKHERSKSNMHQTRVQFHLSQVCGLLKTVAGLGKGMGLGRKQLVGEGMCKQMNCRFHQLLSQ